MASNTLSTQNVLNTINSMNAQNNALAVKNAQAEMNFNSAEAKKNRDWQEKMSNTAHQREVADLIAAGLNPVLSAGGTGASTPTGSSASGSTAEVDTSGVSALVSYANSLINSATAITTAEISKKAMTDTASINAGAVAYSANKSYQSTVYSSDKSYASNENVAKNYPSTPYGLFNGAVGGINNFVSSLTNAIGSVPTYVSKGGVNSLINSLIKSNKNKNVTKRR